MHTLRQFRESKGWTQRKLVEFLDGKGVTITAQYLNDVLNDRRNPGPKFIAVFKEITGIELVDGLVERD